MGDPAVVIDWILRVVMLAITILVFVWGRERKASDELLASRFAERDQRIEQLEGQIERRFTDANRENSKLASAVQVLIGSQFLRREDLADLLSRWQAESTERRRVDEAVNATIGQMQNTLARQTERADFQANRIDELWRVYMGRRNH